MRLRYVAEVGPSVAVKPGTEISFLPLETIWADDRFDPSRTILYTGEVASYNPVAEGDILVPKVTPTFSHGRVAVATGLVNGAALATSEVFVVRARDRSKTRFLRYRLLGQDFRTEGEASQYGVAGLKRISAAFLRDVRIADGPWRQAAEVADFLDRECERISAVTARRQQQLEQVERLRSAIVHDATAPLRRRRLKDGYRVIDCKHRTPEYVPDGWPVVSTREVCRGSLDLSTVERFVDEADYRDLRYAGRDPRVGDIIYSRNASVGVAAYLSQPVDVCMGQDVVLITRRPRDCALLSYVLNYAVADQVERLSVGSTFSRINVPVIRALIVPDDTSDREFQALREIEAEFGNLERVEQLARQSLTRLSEYRDSLITEAVTGQLDVSRMSDAQMDERAHAAMEGATA